jgi:hypothetical protein
VLPQLYEQLHYLDTRSGAYDTNHGPPSRREFEKNKAANRQMSFCGSILESENHQQKDICLFVDGIYTNSSKSTHFL